MEAGELPSRVPGALAPSPQIREMTMGPKRRRTDERLIDAISPCLKIYLINIPSRGAQILVQRNSDFSRW